MILTSNLCLTHHSPKLMGLEPRPFRAAFLVQFIDPVFPVYGIIASLKLNVLAAGQASLNGQALSSVRPRSGAVACLSTHQEST